MRILLCPPLLLAMAFSLQSCNRLLRPFSFAPSAPAKAIQVGQLAPEIDGIDLDGRPLKLSDQRGKVVALVFWGHW